MTYCIKKKFSKTNVICEFNRLKSKYRELEKLQTLFDSLINENAAYHVNNGNKNNFFQRLERSVLDHCDCEQECIHRAFETAISRIQIHDCLQRCALYLADNFQLSSAKMRQARQDYATLNTQLKWINNHFKREELLEYMPIQYHSTINTPSDLIEWHSARWQKALFEIESESNFVNAVRNSKKLVEYLHKYQQIRLELVPDDNTCQLQIIGEQQNTLIEEKYFFGKKSIQFIANLSQPSWHDLIRYEKVQSKLMKYLFLEIVKQTELTPEAQNNNIPPAYHAFLPSAIKNSPLITWKTLIEHRKKSTKAYYNSKPLIQKPRSLVVPERLRRGKLIPLA